MLACFVNEGSGSPLVLIHVELVIAATWGSGVVLDYTVILSLSPSFSDGEQDNVKDCSRATRVRSEGADSSGNTVISEFIENIGRF